MTKTRRVRDRAIVVLSFMVFVVLMSIKDELQTAWLRVVVAGIAALALGLAMLRQRHLSRSEE
ncbi:MAG: hypothetical protein ABL886_01705 [Rhodoglobus sp.]